LLFDQERATSSFSQPGMAPAISFEFLQTPESEVVIPASEARPDPGFSRLDSAAGMTE
jgi:hypothetical protein